MERQSSSRAANKGRYGVEGDHEALCRAVRNLAENAVDNTPEGSIVEIAVSDDGTISVLDQGPGIADSERELIFQRFWRRDRSRNGSAGLGLSIVSKIVEAHAGTLTVANRPTGGASFCIVFGPPKAASAAE
jgi:signal transduction histidine kinase